MPASCYYPDGTLSTGNPQLVPCDPSAPAGSSCCATGDTCFSNGLCMSTEFFYYRGGCTDNKWEAGSCAKQCVSVSQESSSNSLLNFFQVITSCQNVFDSVNAALGGQNFTCSPVAADCQNGHQFTLGPSNITATKITGNAVDTSSSNSSSTVTVTPSTSASACPAKGVSPAVTGVAVAVPVVVISILALFFFFWERKKRVNAEKNLLHTAAMATNNSNTNGIDSNPNNHRQDLKQYVPIVEAGDGDVNRVTELPATDGIATRKPENSHWT